MLGGQAPQRASIQRRLSDRLLLRQLLDGRRLGGWWLGGVHRGQGQEPAF